MAEVIGLISAIGGIAAAGIKVAKVVYALADELGTAGKQVRTLAADTRALSWVLKELNGRLQRMSSIPRDGIKVAHDAAMLIKDEIDGIGEIVKPLISEEGQRMSKKQKAKWIFTKSQITTRQTALNSHKATLSLVLDTLKLIEGQTDAEGLEEEIEHAESEVKHIKTNFEDAERTDLVLEKAYCALQVHTQQKTLQTTAGGGNEQQIVLHGTTSEDVENHDSNALVTLTALISHLDSNNEDTASEAAHQLFLKRHLAIVLYEDIHRRADWEQGLFTVNPQTQGITNQILHKA
ncbi:hypothetical protein DL546_008269 [Coniochaeta pulveracea]|uniref:Fungal N-terminal domain-containing protein n=1 Tax=Coniochaeta pulveracea TaxID=177199 RepID=A0A420YIY6_9PEZI|nr:hypothetical protein DL546_008269 [Coniochaeta pulveracea]